MIGVTSKPEMNGQKGAILNFDQERGNYHIRLPSQSVALKYGSAHGLGLAAFEHVSRALSA